MGWSVVASFTCLAPLLSGEAQELRHLETALATLLAPKIETGRQPVSFHVGPYRLTDAEVATYRSLFMRLGTLLMIFVEPQAAALEELQQRLLATGVGITSSHIRAVNAAICRDEEGGVADLHGFSPQLFLRFPEASQPPVDFRRFSSLDRGGPVDAARRAHPSLLQKWSLEDWSLESWWSAGLLTSASVPCLSLSGALSEVGVEPSDLDVVTLSVDGIRLAAETIKLETAAPAFLSYEVARNDDAVQAFFRKSGYRHRYSMLSRTEMSAVVTATLVEADTDARHPLELHLDELLGALAAKMARGHAVVSVHIGPNCLDRDEVRAYKRLQLSLGELSRMVFVEPQASALRHLRQKFVLAGIDLRQVQLINAAVCPSDGQVPMHGFSKKFFQEFPRASFPDVNFGDLQSLDVEFPLKMALLMRLPFFEHENLLDLTPEDFIASGYLESTPVRCLSPQSLLVEAAVLPKDVEVLIIDAEGQTDVTARKMMELAGMEPEFLMAETGPWGGLTNSTRCSWNRACAWHEPDVACMKTVHPEGLLLACP